MLWLVPRLFTALGIRVSQASRLLTTSIRWRRGWFRPRTTRRRPVKRERPLVLRPLEERLMLGDGTLAGVLATGWLLPNHSPLERVEQSLGAAAFVRTLPAQTLPIDYQPPRDHDSTARLPDLGTILATPSGNTVAQEVTHTPASVPFDTSFVAATNDPKTGDEFTVGTGEFESPSTPSASAKNRPSLPSDALPRADANAGSGGGGPGGASTNNGGGGGGSSGGGGGGPIGGNLATLANQGAFANAAATTATMPGAALPQASATPVAPATTTAAPAGAVTATAAGSPVPPASTDPLMSNTIATESVASNLLWYNGDYDFQSGSAINQRFPGDVFTEEASVYDNFIVPASGGWDISAVFSNNLIDLPLADITGADFSIRAGVSPGNGGTVVASGTNLPVTIAPTGRSPLVGLNEYNVEITGLDLHLAPGTYWLNVTPVGNDPESDNTSSLTGTTGANAVGLPAGNDGNAYQDSVYLGENFVVKTGDFSEGVRGVAFPTANDDSYALPHDTTLSVPAAGVLVNDSDPYGLPLSAVLVSNVSHGNLSFNSDGSFTYAPDSGFTGTDSFTYQAGDGVLTSNTATVTLTVASSPFATVTRADASVVSPAPDRPVTLLATVAAAVPGAGTPTGTITFSVDGGPGQTVALTNGVARLALLGGLALGTHTVQAVYSGDNDFTASQSIVTLDVKAPADLVSGDNRNCGCPNQPGSVPQAPANQTAPAPSPSNSDPVRYADGVLTIAETDLYSAAFGFAWGQTRSWSNGGGYSSGVNGNGWVDTYMPQLIRADGTTTDTLIVVANGTTAFYFTLVNGVYQASFSDPSQLSYNSGDDTYTLIDGQGDRIVFNGFGVSRSAAQRGEFASYTDATGVTMAVTSYTSDGHIAEMQRSTTSGSDTITESFVYSYLPSTDANAGLLSGVTLRRQINGGAWSTVRQVAYTYYDGTQQYGGNLGDLMTASIKDGSGNVLSTSYYRYYTPGQANGYTHGLEYVFNADSYMRLTAALGTNLGSLTDAQVAPYADNYFQYDSQQRVSQETVQGAGDSQTGGGLGTYTFSYTASNNTASYGNWSMKTVVTNPDGSSDTLYTNAYAEVLLDDHYDPPSGLHTDEFFAYNDQGQLILDAAPSAVTGYDDSYADLLNEQSGNYQFLSNSSGLIARYSYYTTTTAGETTAGGVANYVQEVQIQQGQQGTLVPQETWQYYAHAANGQTIAPVATDTVYRNDDGTGAETTTYSYTWFSGTAEIQSETVSAPVIAAAQNGPGTADVTTTVFDEQGNPIWIEDPDGFLHYLAYDAATGAVVKTIVDVDTTQTGEFADLPSGWATPAGGGLNLVTTDAVDALGRTTEETSPGGNITYYVYLDAQHEVRVYQGWNSSTGTPTGPTQVIRQDASGGYTEVLTMSATPHLTNGAPDGSEAISGLQSLIRDYTNAAGQVIAEDAYFNLSGLAYTTAVMGVLGVNYYQAQYGYDNRGRLSRTQTANGTIYRTVYDSLGRPISDWVGTNDTSLAGGWSPSNNNGTANMVMVASYQYDNGGVGDGNLTRETDYPGLGAAPEVTQLWYDWRDRVVAVKAGVQASENDGTHRPIVVTTYDNLDEAIQTQQYDGDGVTPQIVNGVLQTLSSSLLRAQEIDSYDDQGRIYQTQVFDVNPTTGAVSTNALTTNFYYDHRGDLMAESDPGGLWTKSQFDGVGRDVLDFITDGLGGTTWAAANSVAADTVLEQEQTVYDADSNAIETIDRQRFDNATGTGSLGAPSSGIGARVYYAAAYYDPADRVIASVDAGTNGGVAWTRPSSVPASSPTLLVTTYAYNAMGLVQDVTDPQGIVSRTLYDNLGRTTKTIQNYTGGTPGNANDVATEYGYDGNNNVLFVQADEPDGSYQRTAYVYGVTTASGSGVNSNDIQSAVQHPDPTTGNPSSSEQDSYLVNALGQTVQSTDRNGNVHQYTYDVLGRLTADAVTTLGAGVDGSVRRIEYGYDSQGNLSLITSYDAASGGSVVNQVLRQYNGLGQLTADYQSHSGAVVLGSTPKVQYAYNEMANGENNSRLTSMTYAGSYILSYNYNAGLDDRISRLSSLSDNSPLSNGFLLESYKYLGLATVVERDHPQTNINQTYISQTGQTGDAGDPYSGLDRFGRVVNDNWVNATTGQSTDDFAYGYSPDGDMLYRQNLIDAAMSELYQYDNLHQILSFARGTLNATDTAIVGTPSASQSWSPDALGNFNSVTTNGTTQTRTANQQNEITSISGAGAVTYDANGNLTADGSGNTYVYDAWNQLVSVNTGSTTVASYKYDGLGRRITEVHGTNTRELYYSAQGQVLAEWYNGLIQARNVWSPVYVNALVVRDQSRQNNGVLNDRFLVQQDANWNVTALVNPAGTVVERYAYAPFGVQTVLNADFSVRGSTLYAVPYGFQGMRTDLLVGVQFAEDGRVYSPTLMRWLQTDPIGLNAGNNDYQFVGNGPTGATDPLGLYVWNPFSKNASWSWKGSVFGDAVDSVKAPFNSPAPMSAYFPYTYPGAVPSGAAIASPPPPPPMREQLGNYLFAGYLPLSGTQWNEQNFYAWQHGLRVPGHDPYLDMNATLLNFIMRMAELESVAVSLAPTQSSAVVVGRLGSEMAPCKSASQKTWQNFLPEAQMRLHAAEMKYGASDAAMMALSRKQAMKRLEGLEKQVEAHIPKLTRRGSEAHIQHEIESWLKQMENAAEHVGDKTGTEWVAKIAEFRRRVIQTLGE